MSKKDSEIAAELGYGPSKGKGNMETGEPQQCLIKAQSAPDTLRYQHKIEYQGLTFFARDLSGESLAKVKREVKKFMETGKGIAAKQQQYQAQLVKLQREATQSQTVLADPKITPDQETAIEAHIVENQAKQDAVLANLEALGEENEAFADAQLNLMSTIVSENLVGAQWKEGGETKFTREVEFESRKAESEVGEILLGLSMLTGDQRSNLN